MAILINLTGLNRVYWFPFVKRNSDGDGLWYVTIRFLGVEVHFYSRQMSEGLRDLIEGKR